MFDVLFAACLALLIIESAHAQVSAPNCTVSTFNGSTAAYAWVGYPWLLTDFRL